MQSPKVVNNHKIDRKKVSNRRSLVKKSSILTSMGIFDLMELNRVLTPTNSNLGKRINSRISKPYHMM
ncbi:Uncharacterized protein TCM_022781 [Theobroma cacao]|uniref:Uncharacterized protein n=1 Tax=Theobroma cacao TaxID=3641 RepID=A0A061EUR2_THECC|nr:Uncharacterized protein TCM_022781 [Theobroma cacao]